MIPSFPFRERLIGLDAFAQGILTLPWQVWLRGVTDALNAAPQVQTSVTGTPTGASIGTTTLLADTGSAGVFRVSWFLRITRAATTSSSVAVTVGFTDGAVTGNTTTTIQQQSVIVRCDAASALTYSTTYSSAGATSMQYALSVVVERVNG
jgi:hypothetical protein